MRVSTTLVSEFRSDVKLLDYSFQWKNDSECNWMYWYETFKHDETTRVIRGLQLLEVQCNVLARFSLMRDGNIIYPSPWFGQVTRTNQPTLVGFGGKPGDQLILWTFSWSGHCNRTSYRGANTNVLGENGNRNRRRRRTAERTSGSLAMSHVWHSLTPRDLCLCCSI